MNGAARGSGGATGLRGPGWRTCPAVYVCHACNETTKPEEVGATGGRCATCGSYNLRPGRRELAPLERSLLLHIRGQLMATGCVPSRRDLAELLGRSVRRVQQLLAGLVAKGYARTERGKRSRAITLLR